MPDDDDTTASDDNTHARRTLSMLRQADREGVDVDAAERIEELEDEVEGEDDGA